MTNQCCTGDCNQGRACTMRARTPATGGVFTIDIKTLPWADARELRELVKKNNGRLTVAEARREFVKGWFEIFCTTLTAVAVCGFFGLFFFPAFFLGPLVAILAPIGCWAVSKRWAERLPADRANDVMAVIE